MAIDHMDKEDNIKDELGGLSNLPAKPNHLPPTEYFESMPGKVIQRWKEEEKRIHHHRIVVRRWISIAAITCGVLLGGWWMMHQAKVRLGNPLALSHSEAYQYVMDNINEFDVLMEQEVQWPREEKIMVQDSSAAQEFLLEELQGNEIEQIF